MKIGSPLSWRGVFGLFITIASVTMAAERTTSHLDRVPIPQIPRPDYLHSYIDPTFGATVTRISGEPGSAIPNLNGQWSEVARHLYSKTAAWNCNQSLLLLARHHGYPSLTFLHGSTYQPIFGRNQSPGTEIRWHPQKPEEMVYVHDNTIGLWNVRQNTTQTIATFPEYSDFSIGPWEGNLSWDGSRIVLVGKNRGSRSHSPTI